MHLVRRQRISKACQPCNKKKKKCSGELPCNTCVTRNIECFYTEPTKKRGPAKKSGDIEDTSSRTIGQVDVLEANIENSPRISSPLRHTIIPREPSNLSMGSSESYGSVAIRVNDILLDSDNSNPTLYPDSGPSTNRNSVESRRFTRSTSSLSREPIVNPMVHTGTSGDLPIPTIYDTLIDKLIDLQLLDFSIVPWIDVYFDTTNRRYPIFLKDWFSAHYVYLPSSLLLIMYLHALASPSVIMSAHLQELRDELFHVCKSVTNNGTRTPFDAIALFLMGLYAHGILEFRKFGESCLLLAVDTVSALELENPIQVYGRGNEPINMYSPGIKETWVIFRYICTEYVHTGCLMDSLRLNGPRRFPDMQMAELNDNYLKDLIRIWRYHAEGLELSRGWLAFEPCPYYDNDRQEGWARFQRWYKNLPDAYKTSDCHNAFFHCSVHLQILCFAGKVMSMIEEFESLEVPLTDYDQLYRFKDPLNSLLERLLVLYEYKVCGDYFPQSYYYCVRVAVTGLQLTNTKEQNSFMNETIGKCQRILMDSAFA